jgi:hypothetical protein
MNEKKLQRRTVTTITHYLEPKDIYQLITERSYTYKTINPLYYVLRDRALMALAYCSGGRISPLVGDYKYKSVKKNGKNKAVKIGKYNGALRDNLKVKKDFILVTGLEVGKRTNRVIDKYGEQAGIRDDFIIPLKRGLYENIYYDQFAPFGWLIIEYLETAKPEGELFSMSRQNAYDIIKEITQMYPNWFRAHCEHFYGNFIFKDSVLLSKFMKVVRPEETAHYIGFDWKAGLKGEQPLDFAWIEPSIETVQKRIPKYSYAGPNPSESKN